VAWSLLSLLLHNIPSPEPGGGVPHIWTTPPGFSFSLAEAPGLPEAGSGSLSGPCEGKMAKKQIPGLREGPPGI